MSETHPITPAATGKPAKPEKPSPEADRRRRRVRIGRFVRCLIRGKVEVVGFTDGPIPCPLGKMTRRPTIIVYGGLAQAVRRAGWARTPAATG